MDMTYPPAPTARKWRYGWALWLAMGSSLLIVDTWNSIALVRSISGALQSRPIEASDTALAVLAAFAMTSSQLWLFAQIGGDIGPAGGTRRAVWLTIFIIVPGIILNVAANFFVFVGGQPSPTLLDDLSQALSRGGDTAVGRIFVIFAGMLAMIVSFFPEFLLERGWREKG